LTLVAGKRRRAARLVRGGDVSTRRAHTARAKRPIMTASASPLHDDDDANDAAATTHAIDAK